MEAVTEIRRFYVTTESVYSFFGHGIVRWQKLQNVHDRSRSNSKFKALNPTQWSDRYHADYALKERIYDVMKCLTIIIPARSQKKEIKLWK